MNISHYFYACLPETLCPERIASPTICHCLRLLRRLLNAYS
jgi:hypothetical protein